MIRFLAELRKLALLFRADPRAIAAGVIAPTAILVIFAITFGNMAPLRVAVVNHDTGTHGAAFAQTLLAQTSPAGGSPYFLSPTGEEAVAMQAYQAGEAAGVVVIPADFSKSLLAGANPRVKFYFDNYNSDMAKNMRLYLDEGIVAYYVQAYPDFQIKVREVLSVDKQVEWFDLIAVGVFMLAALVGAMFSFVYLMFKERAYRTDLEYAFAPASMWPFWWARVVFAVLLGLGTGALNAGLVWFISGLNLFAVGVDVWVPLLLIMTCWIAIAAIVSLGVRRFAGAAVGSMVAAVLCWFIGGGTSSVRYLAGAQRVLAGLVPNTYALDLMRQAVFSYGDSRAVDLVVLSSVTLVAFGAAILVYRRGLWRR